MMRASAGEKLKIELSAGVPKRTHFVYILNSVDTGGVMPATIRKNALADIEDDE